MRSIFLLTEPVLCVKVVEGDLGQSIDFGDYRFSLRKTTEDIVFYDWLSDRDGSLCALEIHLPPDHPALATSTPFNKLRYVDTDCFPHIWLIERRECRELGKEAFGDIFFFGADDGRLGIVVGIDDWLSQQERDRLLRDLRGRG